MDEQAVPRSAAFPDPGYHDDDELAAALAAQLDRLVETGAVPLQREDLAQTVPTAPAAAPTPSAGQRPSERAAVQAGAPAEPPTLTGPLKPPSHRADAAAAGTAPIAAAGAPEHHPEHRADRAARAAHRSDPPRDAAAPSSSNTEPRGPVSATVGAELGVSGRVDVSLAPEEAQSSRRATEAARVDAGATRARAGSVPVGTTAVGRGVAVSTGTGVVARSTGTLPTDTGGVPTDTGGVPTYTGSLGTGTGSVATDTGSLPLSRRARRAEERARAQVQAAESASPETEPVDVPAGASRRSRAATGALATGAAASAAALPPRAQERDQHPVDGAQGPVTDVLAAAGTSRGPAHKAPREDWDAAERPMVPPSPSPEAAVGVQEDVADYVGPVRRRRSFQPPPDLPAEDLGPEPADQGPGGLALAAELGRAAPAEEDRGRPAPESPALVGWEQPAGLAAGTEEADDLVPTPAADAWGRALRIVGSQLDEDDDHEDPGGPESFPVHAGSWFEEPLPTTGTVVLSGSPTEPVPVAEPDDPAEVDEVESGYEALAADTASVGVLPRMVDEGARHVVPTISRGSLDREQIPEGVTEEPASRTLRSGLVAPLATWAGAAGSPLAIITGFALGGGLTTAVGLLLGLALATPAVLRLGAVGGRTGRDAVTAARASLGETTGTAAGVVLLVGRIAIAALGLLGVAEVATSYTGRTGLGSAVPASGAAILAVLLAGLLALGVASWPGRIVGVVLGAAGAISLFVSAAMLVLLAGTDGGAPAAAPSPVPAAVAGFALIGLVVASGAAEVTRRPLAGTGWRLGVLGTGLGAAVAAGVVALGAAAAGAGAGGSATDAFIGAIVDATSVALVGPIAVLLLISAVALVATTSRAAGTAAVSLLDRGRSTGLGTAAAALVAIAVALAALAAGLGATAALVRFGPFVAVPLTAVLAALTAAPAVRRGAGRAPLLVLGATVLLGWLLVDQLLVPGERSPLLDLVGLPTGSSWRSTPAVGLLVAAIGGAVAGGLAHLRPGGARDDSTERLPVMQTATPE